MVSIKDLNLMGIGDACKFIRVSKSRLHTLVRNYKIPHKITSAGKIFLKEDLAAFQKSRAGKMKHGRK